MSESVKITIFVVAGFTVFLGAMLALLWFLRDRIVPKTADFGEDEADEMPEEKPAGRERTERAKTPAPSVTYAVPASQPADEYDDDIDLYDDEEAEDGETEDSRSYYSQQPEREEKAPLSSKEEPKTAHLENILDCLYLPGRTLSECGIPEACVSADGSEVVVDGELFGKYAYGGLTLLSASLKEPVMDSFYAVSNEIGYEECKGQLAALYGEAVSEGEQEDETDGSRTVYAAFMTDFGTLWLSKGSGNEYVNLNLMSADT